MCRVGVGRVFLWRCGPTWAMASTFLRFLDHTQRRITVGRTTLDEWSARRRDLYLTTHNNHNRKTSMPSVGLEPTISAGERPQTYALDRAATRTCRCRNIFLWKVGQPPIRPPPGVTFKNTTKFILTAMNTSALNTNNGDNSALHTQWTWVAIIWQVCVSAKTFCSYMLNGQFEWTNQLRDGTEQKQITFNQVVSITRLSSENRDIGLFREEIMTCLSRHSCLNWHIRV